MYRRSWPRTLTMKVQDVGWVGVVLTKNVSTPNCFRSCSTNPPKRSSPTLPNTLGFRPSLLKSAAVFAAHPPTLTRYLSIRHSSPAAGSESRLLPNTSATNRPRQTTSAIFVPTNLGSDSLAFLPWPQLQLERLDLIRA